MGPAALFRRRIVPLSLLAVVGAVVLALWVLPGGDDPAVLQSRVIDRGPGVVSSTVSFQPGWQVPDLTEIQEAMDDHEMVALAAAGSDTTGASVDINAGSTMALIRTDGPATLATRIGTEGRWSEWTLVTINDVEGPDRVDPGEGADTDFPVAGPMWLGDSRQLELLVVGGQLDKAEVLFLGHQDNGPDADLFEPASASLNSVGGVERPPIIPREQWATGTWNYESSSCDRGPSVADHLQALVVHHTVTNNNYGEEDVDDLLRAIYYGHVVVNGWCDIGYNFVVDRFGRIWEARTDSAEQLVIGGHARGFNTGTVGVALLGQHHPGSSPSAAVPTGASEAAVEALAHWKLGTNGVDPAGHTWLRNRSSRQPQRLAGDSWHYVPTVLGHRDLGVTSCPGNHGYRTVDALPARLTARRDTTLPYQFAGWQAHGHGPGMIVAEATGGLRPAGSAEPLSPAPAELSAADPAIAVGGSRSAGYLLRSLGALVELGAAPPVIEVPSAGAGAVDLQVRTDGVSGWVLDSNGVLHGFGGVGDLAPDLDGAGSIDPVAVSVDDGGNGYVADRQGSLHRVGTAPPVSPVIGWTAGAAAVDVDLGPDGGSSGGGWILDDRGFVHGFGSLVPATGSPHRVFPPEAVRAVVAADAGPGGWVVDADGQLWPFGGARLVFPVTTNASAANVIDADGVGQHFRSGFLDQPDARFITAVQQLFLGQAPSVEAVGLGVTDLEQGVDRIDLTSVLARSEHWSGSSLDQMYRDVLGREPDSEGRRYWLGEIAAGLNLQDLGTYFYGSPEYATRAGSTGAYVTGLYRALLGREPDQDGLAYWVDLLDTGAAAPPDVANGFYASVESRRDRAIGLHQQVLGSSPSDAERDRWADRLLAVGDAGVAAELAASSNYYQRVTG